MNAKLNCALVLSAVCLACIRSASAAPINTIAFQDGNVLNVQGTFGSGADTAYLAIDLNNAGVTYAWQFNWDPSTPVNGWQMMEDIAGQSIITTSGAGGGVTAVSNPAGDPNLTLTATYFASFVEHEIINVQYGAALGANSSWDFYTGSYNPANLSATDPQGMTWTSSGVGVDEVNLTNGEFIGWVDVLHHPPVPTLAETPEPRMAGACVIMSVWLLSRPRRGVA